MGVLPSAAIGIFLLIGLAVIVAVVIFAEKADQRNQYERHIALIAPGNAIPSFEQWKAWKQKPRTNHNSSPSSGTD